VTEHSAPEYHEPARSYASLWLFAGLIGTGFVIDLILGGGISHLLGWSIALVVVVGLNFVVLYAVRSEKSLHVTTGEVRVGDEAIGRAEVVALAFGVDDADLPVLGWPMGRPRSLKGLTVRLSDGQDVVVPTRFPQRLAAVLDVHTAAPARGQDVRAAGRADLALLDEIGDRADTVFRTAGYDLPDIPLESDDIAAAKAVFVAGRPPVGFVMIEEVDGLAHIAEIAVIPKWMRQGIGNRLLERACEWARTNDYPAVTLITFADVPWNGPYYAARGFVEVTELSPGLAALRERERELGLDAAGRRVVMRRAL
jgi:ribosomal protein S18 acetylase RimI-like enzyme